ncbi:MAG: AEC family transporter [Akkermansiaceae bacterium]
MQESLLVLIAVFPVYVVVALGVGLRYKKILNPEMDKGIIFVAVHICFPCLILDKMLGAEVLQGSSVAFSSAAMGLGLILAGMLLAWVTSALLGLSVGAGRRTFTVSTGIQNYGYFAIPLIAHLFPDDNVMAVLFTHNLGVEIAMWIVGVMILSGDTRPTWRVFIKGPIMAMVLGILLTTTRTDHLVPSFLFPIFEMLGQCAVPLSILMVGTTWYDLFGKAKLSWKVSTAGILLRLFLIPALFLIAAKYLPLAIELKQVLIVQAALPAAMFPIVLARHYGGRTEVAIQVVLATTIASIVTMPFVISFGSWWIL